MSSRRRWIRNLLFSGLSAGSNAFALLLLMYASRPGRLSVDEMGVMGLGFAFAAIGEPLMDFGLQQASLRHIARDKTAAGDVLASSLPLKAVSGAAMLAILSGVAFWRFPAAAPVAVVMLAAAAIRSYILTIRGVLQGLERFGHEAGVMLVDRALMLAGGVLALRLGYGVMGLALSFVLTRSITLGVGWRLTRVHVSASGNAFDVRLWRELGSAALPLGMFGMVLSVYNYVDVLILGALAGEREVGLYHNAYRIYEALTYAAGALVAVLTPRFAALWVTDRAAHGRLARLGLAGALLLSLVIAPLAWVLAPTVLAGFYGAEYAEATRALRILCAGLGLIFAIWVLHALAISAVRSQLLLTTTLACLVVNVALNYLLIPLWHRDGAAVATVGGEVVGVVMLAWGLRDVLRVRRL